MSNYVHEVEPILYGFDNQEGINQNLGPVISDVHTGTFRDGDLIAGLLKPKFKPRQTLSKILSRTDLQVRGSLFGVGGSLDFKRNLELGRNQLSGATFGAFGLGVGASWNNGKCEVSLKYGATGMAGLFVGVVGNGSAGFAVDFNSKIKITGSVFVGCGVDVHFIKFAGGRVKKYKTK